MLIYCFVEVDVLNEEVPEERFENLNNLKFIEFYHSIDKPDILKINSPAALLLFATFKHSISPYYWRFSPIYSYNLYFLQ